LHSCSRYRKPTERPINTREITKGKVMRALANVASGTTFTRFVACLPLVLSLKYIIGSSIKKTRKMCVMAEPQGTPACALTTSGSISVVLFNREKQKENYPTPHTAYHTRHSAS